MIIKRDDRSPEPEAGLQAAVEPGYYESRPAGLFGTERAPVPDAGRADVDVDAVANRCESEPDE